MYTESILTTSLSGYITYRANDLFDPQATSSGVTASGNQQPQFFDTWKLMYNRYCVIGSSISLKIVNGGTNTVPTFWEVSPEDALVTTSNAVQASVARFADSEIHPSGVSAPARKFKRTMSTAVINGISQEKVMDNPDYSAVITATPADPWYWQVRYSAVDFTTTAIVYGFIHITFDVIFTDPVQDDDNDFIIEKMRQIVDKHDYKSSSKDEVKPTAAIKVPQYFTSKK
jgi:hypothetical protein